VQPSRRWAFFLPSIYRERKRSLESDEARSSGKPTGRLHALPLCSACSRSKPLASRRKVGDLTAASLVRIKALRKPACLLKTSEKKKNA